MRVASTWLVLLVGLGLVTPAWAAFDDFSEDRAPTRFELLAQGLALVFKGELELALWDLEGKGGPGYDSPTDMRTLGTRSPIVEVGAFRLAVRLGIDESLWVNSVLEMTPRLAYLGAVWVDYREDGPAWLNHHVELGYQVPIVKIDRRTERYPLIGTIYWREPELHVAYEALFRLGAQATIEVGTSLAMMRPLSFKGVQGASTQAGTINVLSYGPAQSYSGNSPVVGGRVRAELWGAFVDAWAFVGKLAAREGTDVLISGFSAYRDLPAFSGESDGGDFHWWGGRVGYAKHGLLAFAEAIASREDLLERWGAYGQVSYRFVLGARWLHTLEPLVRYEIYRILGTTEVLPSGRALRSPAPINAVTWDFEAVTLALISEVYRDLLTVRLEYFMVAERNGVPALDIADEPLRNDELMLQLELRF